MAVCVSQWAGRSDCLLLRGNWRRGSDLLDAITYLDGESRVTVDRAGRGSRVHGDWSKMEAARCALRLLVLLCKQAPVVGRIRLPAWGGNYRAKFTLKSVGLRDILYDPLSNDASSRHSAGPMHILTNQTTTTNQTTNGGTAESRPPRAWCLTARRAQTYPAGEPSC